MQNAKWEDLKQKCSKQGKSYYDHCLNFKYVLNNSRSNTNIRMKRTTKLKTVSLNIKHTNEITKRQQVTKWLKDSQIDIGLFQETNRNTADVENSDIWDGYNVFYSTSIDPKIREAEMKKREERTTGRKGDGKGRGEQNGKQTGKMPIISWRKPS